jgi:hypothetical protein
MGQGRATAPTFAIAEDLTRAAIVCCVVAVAVVGFLRLFSDPWMAEEILPAGMQSHT